MDRQLQRARRSRRDSAADRSYGNRCAHAWLYFDHTRPQPWSGPTRPMIPPLATTRQLDIGRATQATSRPGNSTARVTVHVMDTAMFYPAYLDLSSRQATALVSRMMDNAVRSGGCLTISWHDRSLAPERLWDACYRDLIQELRNRGAWFATAAQAVSWFRNDAQWCSKRIALNQTACARCR